MISHVPCPECDTRFPVARLDRTGVRPGVVYSVSCPTCQTQFDAIISKKTMFTRNKVTVSRRD